MYIRTIFGSIYKVDNNKYGVIEENGIFKKYCENMGHSWYSELVATKQSENIGELCDEFVIVRNGERPTILINYDNLSLLKARVVKDNQKVYGAVWCEFGLKYVAKINVNGDLELI